MISSSDVYWVMQMDSIGTGLVLLGLMFFVASVVSLIVFANKNDSFGALCFAVGLFFLSMCCFVTDMFLPSSKTAAAMIILPAITSNEAVDMVKPEARELYELTKSALRKLADVDPKGATEESVEKGK